MTQLAISTYLNQDGVNQSIRNVLGAKAPQFVASVAAVVNSNNQLQQADRKSILMACLTAAALDLPINQNLGFAYIIPYKNKAGELVAQFQMGYKSFIQLCQRSNQMKTINVTDVRQGELKGINRLTGETEFEWSDDPNRDKLPVIGYVAFFELLNGFRKSMFMTTEELKKHGGKYSQTMRKGYGLWVDEFDSMAKKTVLKLLLAKYAPLTTDMAKAIEADQAIVKDDGQYEYPDNQPVDAEEVARDKERARVIKHIETAQTVEELKQCEEALMDDEVVDMYRCKVELLTK